MNDPRQQLEMQLSAYLDDELDRDERRQVEALLASDENARALLEHLRATVEAVRGLPRLRASDQFVESLRSRMERQSLLDSRPVHMHEPITRGRYYLRWTAAAAVLALTVTAGYLMWSLSHDRLGRPNDHYALLDESQKTKTSPLSDADFAGNADRISRSRGKDLPAAPTTDQPDVLAAGRAGDGEEQVRSMVTDEKRKELEPMAPAMRGQPRDSGADKLVETSKAVRSHGGPAAPGPHRLGQSPVAGSTPHAPGDFAFGAPGTQLGDKSDVELGLPLALQELAAKGQAVNGRPAPPTAVVELTFADAGSQREAVQLLRDEYNFQLADPAVRATGSMQVFARQVPDQAVAREVVASVERSLSEARVRVVYCTFQEQESVTEGEVPVSENTLADSRAGGRAARGRQARPATAAAPSPAKAAAEVNRSTTPLEVTTPDAPSSAYKPKSEPAGGNTEKTPTAAPAEPPAPSAPSESPPADQPPTKGEQADKAHEMHVARRSSVAGPAALAPTTAPASPEGTTASTVAPVGTAKPDSSPATRPQDRRFGGGQGPGATGGMGGAGHAGGFGSFGAAGKPAGSRPAPDQQKLEGFGRGALGRAGFRFNEERTGREHLSTNPAGEPTTHVIRLYVWVEPPATQPVSADEPTPTTAPASQPALTQ